MTETLSASQARRLDLRAERAAGCLAVHTLHLEAPGLADEALQALALELQTLATWLELNQFALHCQSACAQRWRACLA